MKKAIFAAVAAAVCIGAVAPAFASEISNPTTYAACDKYDYSIADTDTDLFVKHCAKFVVGEGIISYGDHEGKVYKNQYPDAKFRSLTEAGVKIHKKKLWFGFWQKTKYVYEINKDASLRTKQIAPNQIDETLAQAGFIYNHRNPIPVP